MFPPTVSHNHAKIVNACYLYHFRRLTILVTVLCSIPITLAGIVKLLVPIPAVWRYISAFADFMMWCWCQGLALLLRINGQLRWDIEGLEGLDRKNWYLLISNHESWSDIVVLCVLFRNHIPMNKYFLKQQLAQVPFVGFGLLGAGYAIHEALLPRLFAQTPRNAARISKRRAVPAKNSVSAQPPSSISSKVHASPKPRKLKQFTLSQFAGAQSCRHRVYP